MAIEKNRARLIAAGVLVIAGVIAAYVVMRGRDDAPSGARSGAAGDTADGAGRIDPGARRGGPVGRKGARDPWADPTMDADGMPVLVQGRVLDAYSHAPAAGVDVAFVSAAKKGTGPEYVATSGDDGTYRIEIITGTWSVRARGDGIWADPQRLVVALPRGGGPVGHDVLIQRAGTITGRVVTSDGRTLAGVAVSIELGDQVARDVIAESLGGAATTDAAGHFELAAPPGESRLRAERTGDDGTISLGYGHVPVLAPGGAASVDVVIPDPATIGGTVVSYAADSAGTAGAEVHLLGKDPAGMTQKLTATSDAGGKFRFSGVHPGAVTIEARLPGGPASTPVKLTVQAGDESLANLLTLEQSVAMTGIVVDSAGAPVPDARVVVGQIGSYARLPYVKTGEDGRFEIKGTIAAAYDISVTAGTRAVRRKIDFVPGEPIELVLATPGGIHGVVQASAAVGALSVSIEGFVPAADGTRAPAVASATFSGSGDFSLPGLAPGRYDLLVTAAGHAGRHVPGVVVSEGAWAEVTVELDAGARLDGTVRDDTGPVAGARVAVQGGRTAFTDAAGKFAIDAVPVGPVTINVTDETHPAAARSAVVGPAGATVAIELGADGGRDVEGVGVFLRDDTAGPVVQKIARGAPASGQIPSGATIVAVDGVAVSTVATALARVRGPSGTQVTLTLTQGGKRWDVTLTRARVHIDWDRSTVALGLVHVELAAV